MKEVKNPVLRSMHFMLLLAAVCSLIFLFVMHSGWIRTYRLLANDSAAAAEQQYTIMEENLRIRLEDFETLHPEYHKYDYELDDIGHDPNELMSILSAIHGDSFAFADVQETLDLLFRKQYVLTQRVETSKRYVKGKEVDYSVCRVTLENHPLAQLAPLVLNGEQYTLYMETMKLLESN